MQSSTGDIGSNTLETDGVKIVHTGMKIDELEALGFTRSVRLGVASE